jgi:hypothetical protein
MELTKEQMIRHIKPTIIKEPRLVKSTFVVYPKRLKPPKNKAVTKKQFAKLDPVYIKNNGDRKAPIKAEYNQNKTLAVPNRTLFILIDKYITIPKVPNINTIEKPPIIKLITSDDDTHTVATIPVTHKAQNMRTKTERIYSRNPLSTVVVWLLTGPFLKSNFLLIIYK